MWNYWFVVHPRFRYWAYNSLSRRRVLSWENISMKQKFWDKILTIKDLCEILENKNYSKMMHKIQHYAKEQVNKFLLLSSKGKIESHTKSTLFTHNLLSTLLCRVSLVKTDSFFGNKDQEGTIERTF